MPHIYCDCEILKQEILGWELLEKSKIYFFLEKKVIHADFFCSSSSICTNSLLAGGADRHGDVIGFPKKSIYLIREALYHHIWVYFDIQSKKA